MNWTQPKSFASKFHGQCKTSERDVLKGKRGVGGGGVNAHVWVRILFPITVIEFDF